MGSYHHERAYVKAPLPSLFLDECIWHVPIRPQLGHYGFASRLPFNRANVHIMGQRFHEEFSSMPNRDMVAGS